MWTRFLSWWKEIHQAGNIMDAYVDDSIGRIQPGKNGRYDSAQKAAWTGAANWAFTKTFTKTDV